MREIPGWLYKRMGRDVVIEPYAGSGPYGDIHDPQVTVRAIVESRRQLVRGETGDQVISETTLRCPLTVSAPPQSRVTIDGQPTTVIEQRRHDGGTLHVPSHLEVLLR